MGISNGPGFIQLSIQVKGIHQDARVHAERCSCFEIHQPQKADFMKKLNLLLLSFCMLQMQAGLAQVIRPFSHRYYNPAVRGNIVYVSNSIITSAGIGNGNPGTGENPPGGTSLNNGDPAENINVADITTLIPYGSSWKYWCNNQANYPVSWPTTAFNDAAWPSGNAELGYGDGDEATCIPSGGGGTLCSPTGSKWITSYFRKTINIQNLSAFRSFIFKVERDDGYVVYVNGTEVARDNLPQGAISWSTLANSNTEDEIISFTVNPTAFVPGNNIIAVEIHQNASSSSDLSFNLELAATKYINSSTADLTLPNCSNVLWAGLYWGAGQGDNGSNAGWISGENACKLKMPGAGNYISITASAIDYHNNTLVPGLYHTGYKCFANITSLINTNNPNGTYMVADVVTPIGTDNGYGGWTIVIAYQNPADIIRELNVYDGNAIVGMGSAPININLGGFHTPATGPVSCEFGAVVFDGDRSSLDSFSFRQNGASSYFNLTPNSTSNVNDMWNSTISYKGTVVTTRNPAFQNTLGYDADIIDLPNEGNANLGNSQTAAVLRLSSPDENYIVQVVTASISTQDPHLPLTLTPTDVNGGSLIIGDELRYDMQHTNNGNDSALNTYIIDTIPAGSIYKPGSLQIGGVPKTDAAGDDEAEYDAVNKRVIFRVGIGATHTAGGRVYSGAAGSTRFSIYASINCAPGSTNNNVNSQASLYYTGAASGNPFSGRSGFVVSGCFTEIPTVSNVTGTCNQVLPCNIIYFNAAVSDRKVKLDWTVLCDKEAKHFVVERSTDGINFIPVQQVPVRPVVHERESYFTTDDVTAVNSSVIYYRLKTLQVNGKELTGNVIVVKLNTTGDMDVQVFPNPVQEQMQILVKTRLPVPLSACIMDGTGNTVQQFTASLQPGSNTIACRLSSTITAGIYYLRIVMGDRTIRKKIIIKD